MRKCRRIRPRPQRLLPLLPPPPRQRRRRPRCPPSPRNVRRRPLRKACTGRRARNTAKSARRARSKAPLSPANCAFITKSRELDLSRRASLQGAQRRSNPEIDLFRIARGRSAMTGAAGALVLFSGGQDSTTCLALALDRYARVETIGFDYGQRNRVELDQRATIRESLRQNFPSWRERLGEDHLIRIEALAQISTTAMTHDATDARGLPNTFVPGRNLMFLSLAAALAYPRGFQHTVGGTWPKHLS